MNRREALATLAVVLAPSRVWAARTSVATLIGTGSAGYSDQQVNNPYGLVIGPDQALYFCDLDNQRGVLYVGDSEAHRIRTVA